MTVATIMRKDVVTLRPGDGIEAAWRQMRDQRLTALPVTDPGRRLVGLLTEVDLLGRLTPRRPLRWCQSLFDDNARLAADYVKSVGVTVDEVMTARPVAIVPDASVEGAATLMRRHTLEVLPVVASEACLGLVTRADVLDHLRWPTMPAPIQIPDSELERLMHEGIQHELWASRYWVTVEATHGVIQLAGAVGSLQERSALVAMARSLPGCAGVADRIVCDTGRREPPRVI